MKTKNEREAMGIRTKENRSSGINILSKNISKVSQITNANNKSNECEELKKSKNIFPKRAETAQANKLRDNKTRSRPCSQYSSSKGSRPESKERSTVILTSANGMGLWCHTKNEISERIQDDKNLKKQLPPVQTKTRSERIRSANSQKPPPSTKTSTTVTKEVDDKVEASLAQMLEKQISILSTKVEKAEYDKSKIAIKFNQMKSDYNIAILESEQILQKNENLKEKVSHMDEKKREIEILKHENFTIKSKENEYRANYETEVKLRTKETIEFKYKIKELEDILQEYEEDNQNLKYQIQCAEENIQNHEEDFINDISAIDNASIIPSETFKLNDRVSDFDIQSKSDHSTASISKQICELKTKINKEKENKKKWDAIINKKNDDIIELSKKIESLTYSLNEEQNNRRK